MAERVRGRNNALIRPHRDDIAAPDLPRQIEWVGERPPPMAGLTASGPVLVHFFDFGQLNSVRTLPYLNEWNRRYRPAGLRVLGIQSPRFPFGAEREAVAAGLRRLAVSFPVAIDAEREAWRDYGCEGWPSLFLWGQGGVLRWFHFGEGEYRATEEAIQSALRETDALRELPGLMQPLRRGEGPGEVVARPTPELFPAGERAWTAGDGGGFTVEYEAGGASTTAEGEGSLLLVLDGRGLDPVEVSGPGLYSLTEHPRHELHSLAIDLRGEVAIWSVSFSPGLPQESETHGQRVSAGG